MTPRNLLMGTTRLGAGCGIGAGLALGLVPDIVFLALLLFLEMINRNSSSNTTFFKSDTVIVIALFFGVLLVLGLAAGATIGLAVGICCGIMVGTLTYLFFVPLKNRLCYHGITGIASVVLAMWLVFPVYWVIAKNSPPSSPEPWLPDIIGMSLGLIALFPVLSQIVSALLISQFIAVYYQKRMKGVDTTNA